MLKIRWLWKSLNISNLPLTNCFASCANRSWASLVGGLGWERKPGRSEPTLRLASGRESWAELGRGCLAGVRPSPAQVAAWLEACKRKVRGRGGSFPRCWCRKDAVGSVCWDESSLRAPPLLHFHPLPAGISAHCRLRISTTKKHTVASRPFKFSSFSRLGRCAS